MSRRLVLAAVSSIGLAAAATPALAIDTTADNLLNSPNNANNWLMVHRDWNNSRHSPLAIINKDNAKDLKLKYMVSIGGIATGGSTLRGKEEATPLVEDGFMYVNDTWARVMKFDVRSGTQAIPLWRYDPKIKQSRTQRGIAMYGNKIFIGTNDMRMIAINKDSGEVIWEVNAAAPTDPATGTPAPKTQGFTGAPGVVKTKGGKELVLQGELTGGQLGTRSWIGAWDVNDRQARLAHVHRPGPRRARLRDLEGQPQRLARRRRRRVEHGILRSGHQPLVSTAPATRSRASIRNSARATISSRRQRSRSTPTPARSPGTSRRRRTSIGTSTRRARRCSTTSTSTARTARWSPTSRATASTTRSTATTVSSCAPTSTRRRLPGPRASTRRPASRSTTIRPRGVQHYAGIGVRRAKRGEEACPWWNGSPTFFPPTLDAKRGIAYVAGAEGCIASTASKTPMDEKKDYVGLPPCCTEQGRITAHGALWAMDLKTGKVINKVTFQPPTESGMLSTDGGILATGHMRGKFAVYDSELLKELWSFDLGTPITAPPIAFAVDGKQYIAVVAGGAVGVRQGGLYQPAAMVAVFGL